MLLSAGADPNSHNQDGASALFVAAQEGKCDVVKLLHEHGALVNCTTGDGRTPLLSAVVRGFTDVVALLIVRRGRFCFARVRAPH